MSTAEHRKPYDPRGSRTVLGARGGEIPPRDSPAEHLRPKSLLVVVDNCEHLLDECGRVIQALLRACPALRVLATSREALGIPGEWVYSVPPLSLPTAVTSLLGQLTPYESVRLFVERAVLAKSTFAIVSENALALAQLCRQLDGIPLAIELAAARGQNTLRRANSRATE